MQATAVDNLPESLRPDPEYLESIRWEYEDLDVIAVESVSLSLTHRCTWNCLFCYKGCPRNIEMNEDDLRTAVNRLLESGRVVQVGLTGGEPTLYKYWRETAYYLRTMGKGVGLITNATLLSDEDIKRLPQLINSIKISIHGIGEGAKKVTQSGRQRGLEILEKIAKYENLYISVVTLALKENIHEVIPLLERIEKIHDETGKPDEIIVSPSMILGNMVKNTGSYLSREEWEELEREIKQQKFPMDLRISCYKEPYYVVLPSPFESCFEIEPDGGLFFYDLKIGDWRKKRLEELFFYYYKRGWRIRYEAYKQGKILHELPDFRIKTKKKKILKLKKDVRVTRAERKIILEDAKTGERFSVERDLILYFNALLSTPLDYCLENYHPGIKRFIRRMVLLGLAEFGEIEFWDDVEILSGEGGAEGAR